MDIIILEAVNEMRDEEFKTIEEVKEVYTNKEILDSWLRYEGILGYTNKIMEVVNVLNMI